MIVQVKETVLSLENNATDKIFYDQTSSDFEEPQSWSWKQGEKSSKMKIKLCIFLVFVAICIAQQEREKKRKYNTVKDTYYWSV